MVLFLNKAVTSKLTHSRCFNTIHLLHWERVHTVCSKVRKYLKDLFDKGIVSSHF